MSNVQNPFTGSQFVWSPSNTPGSKQIADHLQFVSTNASEPPDVETAATIALEDGAATDFVATVQCAGPDVVYFRCDLRGSWFRDDTTVTDQDPPIAFNHAQENDPDYSAVLDRSGTNIRVRTAGPGRWSIAMTRLVSKRDAFDPLTLPELSATPIVWIDAAAAYVENEDDGDNTLDGVINRATSGATLTISPTDELDWTATNVDYNGGSTIDVSNGQGIKLTDHGLTNGPFSVLFVADGQDTFWLYDSGGSYIINAGGGSGNKLQMTSDATTLLVGGAAKSGVPGVYIFVFDGTDSYIYEADETPVTGSSGATPGTMGTTIGLACAYNTSGDGLNGSFRHLMVFDGALSEADAVYLLRGFGAESGLEIAAP